MKGISDLLTLFFQSAQSVPSYAAYRHLVGFVFSFKSWDKCFCYKQLERHLDKSLIMPTLNQSEMDWKPGRQQVHLNSEGSVNPSLATTSTASTAFQLPQRETPIGKPRAPQCKYCFWFSHKQKTVTENTVVIHSLPKQTQISYLRNSRFLGPSIKITCLKLKLSSQSSEITDYKFLLYPFSPPCGNHSVQWNELGCPVKNSAQPDN